MVLTTYRPAVISNNTDHSYSCVQDTILELILRTTLLGGCYHHHHVAYEETGTEKLCNLPLLTHKRLQHQNWKTACLPAELHSQSGHIPSCHWLT